MYGEKHYQKDKTQIEYLGDFTNKWTARGGLDDGEGWFVNPLDVIHYILDNYHCIGIYQFHLKGKKYECRINATYTELIE